MAINRMPIVMRSPSASARGRQLPVCEAELTLIEILVMLAIIAATASISMLAVGFHDVSAGFAQ